MLVAHFIGSHANDAFLVRLGWEATRAVQRGRYRRVTHCEAILGGTWDNATIASASLRDGARVRTKPKVRMDRANWLIADVPAWSADAAVEWFVEHDGEPYDLLGAAGSAIPFLGHARGRWYCNAAVGASGGLVSSYIYGPAQFAAITFTPGIGRDVTAQFFKGAGA